MTESKVNNKRRNDAPNDETRLISFGRYLHNHFLSCMSEMKERKTLKTTAEIDKRDFY